MKHLKTLMGTTALLSVCVGQAFAQTAPTQAATAQSTPGNPAAETETVIVIGSQIRGASITAALPVISLGQEEIRTTGAVNGDDLLRTIPQMGDVLVSPANNAQTSNSARGDVNSINLRSLGVGNTLVLLNGRRIVQHPTSQGTSDTGTVPVLTYNSNAIPVSGLDRLEVLLDGAAAIYGADAVAGVVNTVTQKDFNGLKIDAQYGGAEGTNLREFNLGVFAGKDFDRGNVSLFVDYTDRTALRAEDQEFTKTDNLRSFFSEAGDFASSLTPDARNTRGAWANLAVVAGPGIIRQGTTALTTAAGAFSIRPTSVPGCSTNLGAGTGICIGSGALTFNTAQRDLRFDTAPGTTITPETQRLNLMLTGHFDINDRLTAFGEIGYYEATTTRIQPPVINLNTLTIPSTNYWNPFGPVTFANGQANPNRLPV